MYSLTHSALPALPASPKNSKVKSFHTLFLLSPATCDILLLRYILSNASDWNLSRNHMCAVKQSPATAEKKEMTPGPASQKFFTSGPGPKDAGSCRSRLRIRGHICRRRCIVRRAVFKRKHELLATCIEPESCQGCWWLGLYPECGQRLVHHKLSIVDCTVQSGKSNAKVKRW